MDVLCPKFPYKKLQDVLQELCLIDSELQENWAQLIENALTLVESLTQTLCVDVESRHKLGKLAVNLWNKTVILKTKESIKKQLYGKLRHISFQVIAFLNESGGDIASLKKQVMMGLKTARAWIDVKEFQSAEKVLCILQKIIQRLQQSVVQMKNVAEAPEDEEKLLSDTTKDSFYILCLKAEVKFLQGQNTQAMDAVKKAEEIMPSFPDEAFNLSMLCYNFGVDCYHSKDYTTGVSWLRESCSINRDIVEPNPKIQARTLRLLANCYLEARCEGWKESALNAVTLANQKYPHVAGLYVRLQLLLESEEPDASVHHALEELMHHPNFDVDLCINSLRLLKNFQRSETIFDMRQSLLERFKRHENFGNLLVSLLDIFLQGQVMSSVHVFAEECIKVHNTECRIEGLALKQFHIFFWMRAAQHFEDLRNFPTLPDFIAQPGVNTNIIDVDHASPSTICHLFFDDFIISHIKGRFQEMFVPDKEISIDGAMCAWRGKLHFKVYLKISPHRGVLNFELCDSKTGYEYRYRFEIYAREPGLSNRPTDVLMRLIGPLLDRDFHLFTDNHYSCLELYTALYARHTTWTATVRSKRVGMLKDMMQQLLKIRAGRGQKPIQLSDFVKSLRRELTQEYALARAQNANRSVPKSVTKSEKKEFEKAATWYNYSLSLYSSMSASEPNLAKLQRNLANCYFNLGEYTKALAAIEVAEKCNKKDAHTQFIIFKISLEQGNFEKAMASLKILVECVEKDLDTADINIICVVAQTALEQNRTELATVALECLISHSGKIKQILTGLKCLLRLLLNQIERNNSVDKKQLLCHVRTALNKILSAKDQGKVSTAEVEDEATWFMKISWNLALQCKDDPFCMKEFFNLCFQLLSLCAQNAANFHHHQNCLLMSCAACVQLAREPQYKPQMQELLEEVLQHIEEYKQAENRAHNFLCSPGSTKASASAEIFLLLYKFEALSKLKDARAECVLDQALTLPSPSPKLFHTFSALAVDAPASNKKLSMRALKVAIKLHMQAKHPDYISCSADVRNLINQSLVSNEKEAMIYFKETLDMIEKRAKDEYPEVELLWLMTKSWNQGLHHFNWDKPKEAEQWCSLSMSLLKYLPSAKKEYHDQKLTGCGNDAVFRPTCG
ncbi:hypothetical protein RRG08_005044 [Elysia crispata]|uniref:Protein ZIP4 homolog n=1 Tax=Elysia crispata TaxID=231223 RepID=A0AAE0XZ23_9GAST|nr:hypothetical protein RRG08_005044 [Elysia crispata]